MFFDSQVVSPGCKIGDFTTSFRAAEKKKEKKKKERKKMPSTSTTRKGKVFVVGTNEVITSAAVTAILCGEGREDDDERISRDEIDSTPNPVNWSLRTRYYTAELEIFHHSITTEADDDAGKEDGRNDDEEKEANANEFVLCRGERI